MDVDRPRITGTEMEWTAMTLRHGYERTFEQADKGDINRALSHVDPAIIRSLGLSGMISNGARLYIDIGDHLEYATPEDTSFMGTVANEIAGEKLLYDAFQKAQVHRHFAQFRLSKRIVDDEWRTWGYHMNFCTDRQKIWPEQSLLRPLAVHLATMNVFAGSGALLPSSHTDVDFVIAQKMSNLNSDLHDSSHGANNPLLSGRSEALSADNRFGRTHITSLDAGLSPWATNMKLGTTSIVLRMIEKRFPIQYPLFTSDIHEVAVQVARDESLKSTFHSNANRSYNALDTQQILIDNAKRFASNEYMPDEEVKLLSEWQSVIDDLKMDPERTIDRVEWVARREVLRRYAGKRAIKLRSFETMQKDRQFSYIGPDSVSEHLRQTLWKRWMPSQESIEHAMFNPPHTTRALARCALIKLLHGSGEPYSVDWNVVNIPSKMSLHFDDPYDPFTVEERLVGKHRTIESGLHDSIDEIALHLDDE